MPRKIVKQILNRRQTPIDRGQPVLLEKLVGTAEVAIPDKTAMR